MKKPRLNVAFLWHMHQPDYVDLSDGRATLPWARLHALKDYGEIPALARRFPGAAQTFNLVPCLLDQIEAYADGSLTDPFLEVASRGARELTRDDRLFLLRHFFSYHPPTMAARLPRLEELRRKRGARAPDPGEDAALAAWREGDYRDLQVLFHLAWSGPSLRAIPEVARLIEKGRGFTTDDLTTLLEIQRSSIGTVLDEYAAAAAEGVAELSASPYYHPILPLLCDTSSALEATSKLPLPAAPFRHPEDARLQIRRGRERFARRFGGPPAGMWPSEGAISDTALALASEEGVRWAASDEDVLFASLGSPPPLDPAERSRVLHRPYCARGGTALFFRDHALSDRIGFVYQTWEPSAAASDFVQRLEAISDLSAGEPRVVSIILDGENPWEFYAEGGRPFLTALFGRLAASEKVAARTFSTVLTEGPVPIQLTSVRAGSWIDANLTTWIGDPDKNRAWEVLAQSRAALGPPAPGTPAGDSLLAAEGSDWFWWFGEGHSSAHDADFDRTFRIHLQNAHRLANRPVPLALEGPIARARTARTFTSPRGPIVPVLDGRAGDYFEWLAAGRADAQLGSGTMRRSARLLRSLRFGAGGGALAIRLDTFAEPAFATLAGMQAVLEFGAPSEARFRVPLARGECGAGAVRAFLERILEMAIPLEAIGATGGDRIEFRLLLEDGGGKPVESLPDDGVIAFSAGADESDWIV